jgi:hypothetical protein
MKSFLNFAGIESNKIHYTKLFLENYLRMQEGTLAEALHYEVQILDLQENLLPPIDPNELIPFTRIDFIMDHIEDFYESNREKARARSTPETQVYTDCLLFEIDCSEQRLQSLRTYFVGKISKVKLRYSLFLHRIEDWIVHSIKTENSIIYDIITNYINDIR